MGSLLCLSCPLPPPPSPPHPHPRPPYIPVFNSFLLSHSLPFLPPIQFFNYFTLLMFFPCHLHVLPPSTLSNCLHLFTHSNSPLIFLTCLPHTELTTPSNTSLLFSSLLAPLTLLSPPPSHNLFTILLSLPSRILFHPHSSFFSHSILSLFNPHWSSLHIFFHPYFLPSLPLSLPSSTPHSLFVSSPHLTLSPLTPSTSVVFPLTK